MYAGVDFIVKYSGLIHFINKIKIKGLVIYLATNFFHCEIIGKRILLLYLNVKHRTFFFGTVQLVIKLNSFFVFQILKMTFLKHLPGFFLVLFGRIVGGV